MNELTLTVFKYLFLLLLWSGVAGVAIVAKNDLAIGTRFGDARKRLLPDKSEKETSEVNSEYTPVRERPDKLLVTAGPKMGTVIPLDSQAIIIGRAEDSTIVLDDDYASGRHARLFPQGSRWFIEDLGSTNGTYLNGLPLSRAAPVDLNTPIKIGQTTIELRK
ncbi:MAG: FHA domain-containing protein [Micrococcaceae bacterium]